MIRRAAVFPLLTGFSRLCRPKTPFQRTLGSALNTLNTAAASPEVWPQVWINRVDKNKPFTSHMFIKGIGGERGIRTLEGLSTLTPLAGERFRPLSHLSDTFSSFIYSIHRERDGFANYGGSPLWGACGVQNAARFVEPSKGLSTLTPLAGERVDSGHRVPRPAGVLALLVRPKSLRAILSTTQPSLRHARDDRQPTSRSSPR